MKASLPRSALLLGATLLATLLAAAPASADSGQITSDTELKSAPDATAASNGRLAAGQAVQLGERQGAWYRVTSPAGEGWVRMLNVRLSGPRSAGVSAGSGLAALGEASRSSTTVATGIRGLSREDLQASHDDQRAVAALAQYRCPADEARQFGQTAGLPAPRR